MKLWLAVWMGLMLSGCATQAYRAVEKECSPAAFADYPVDQVRRLETRQRVIQVSTGMRSCYAVKDGNHTQTICSDITRPELITYQEWVVLDQNEAIRQQAIESCTANLCSQRYGNAKCKTDELLVPVPQKSPLD